MSAVLLRPQADSRNPLINKPSVLSCAQVMIRINSAREDKVLDVTSSAFESSEQAGPGVCRNLKLHWAICLPLSNCCSPSALWTTYQIADLQLDEITASQLAINRQIKQGSISNALLEI